MIVWHISSNEFLVFVLIWRRNWIYPCAQKHLKCIPLDLIPNLSWPEVLWKRLSKSCWKWSGDIASMFTIDYLIQGHRNRAIKSSSHQDTRTSISFGVAGWNGLGILLIPYPMAYRGRHTCWRWVSFVDVRNQREPFHPLPAAPLLYLCLYRSTLSLLGLSATQFYRSRLYFRNVKTHIKL